MKIKAPLPRWLMDSITTHGFDESRVRDALQGWCEGQPMPDVEALRKPPEILQAILFCPYCGRQHIDRDEWATKPHHKHLCEHCKSLWRVEPYCVGVPKSTPLVIPEEGRQMMALALAELSLRRPGWKQALQELAVTFQSRTLFDKFRETSGGIVLPEDEHAKLMDGAMRAELQAKYAQTLADEVDVLVQRKVIDSRSPAADALLDFREPPSTERSDRLVVLEGVLREVMEAAFFANSFEGRLVLIVRLIAKTLPDLAHLAPPVADSPPVEIRRSAHSAADYEKFSAENPKPDGHCRNCGQRDDVPQFYDGHLVIHSDGKGGFGCAAVVTNLRRTCNLHADCNAADEEARANGKRTAHCHDEDCEDCFGK